MAEDEKGSSSIKQAPSFSAREKLFLGSLAAGMLLAGFIFSVRWKGGVDVAPAAPAIAFGVGVATLFYTFLPGNEANIAIRGIKLTGAAALFGVVAFYGNRSLEAQFNERQARAAPVVLPEGSAYRLSSGGTLFIEDITATRGELRRAQREPRAAAVFAELLTRAHAPPPPAPLAALTPAQWDDWLSSLSQQTRDHVIGISFAHLVITASDGNKVEQTGFKRSEITVRDKRGRPEAVLCIARIFNVVEHQMDEDDSLVLTPGECSSG